MDWAPSRAVHLHVDAGLYLRETMGESLVLACHRTDARGLVAGGAVLVRRALPDGALLWATPLDTPATALVMHPERSLVVFALTNGLMGILAAATGAIELLEPVTIDTVPCVYLSLAAQGNRIAAGTVDGRIVISERMV